MRIDAGTASVRRALMDFECCGGIDRLVCLPSTLRSNRRGVQDQYRKQQMVPTPRDFSSSFLNAPQEPSWCRKILSCSATLVRTISCGAQARKSLKNQPISPLLPSVL